MKKEYKLFNRDNLPVSLKLIEDNDYRLVIDDENAYISTSKLGDEYKFIDPQGGPMIALGGLLECGNEIIKVKQISYDEENKSFVCKLKKIRNK